MYFNADQIFNKIDELILLIGEKKPDLVAIVETLPKNFKHGCDHIIVPGYRSIMNNSGRGVCLLVKDGLNVVELDEFKQVFGTCIVCRVHVSEQESVLFGVVYRSPNCSEEECKMLFNLLRQIVAKNNHDQGLNKLCLVGDFNFSDIDWINNTCSKNDSHLCRKFYDVVQELYLQQLVDRPTHYRCMQTPTLIDLLFTDNEEHISNVQFLPPLGKSHHLIITFNIAIEQFISDHSEGARKYAVDKADFVEMRHYLAQTSWRDVVSDDLSVDQCWSAIESKLRESMDLFIPVKQSNKNFKGTKTRIPGSMLEKVRAKRRAFRMFCKYRTQENYNEYAKLRNQVKWESRKLTKSKEVEIAKEAKLNPKKFFHYVSSKTKPREGVSTLLKDDGTLAQQDKDKADVLNTFFSSVFTVENDGEMPSFTCNGNPDPITHVSVSVEAMSKALKNLNASKSPGPDGLHPRILKELHNELAEPFTYLFNKSLMAGIVPQAWKVAEVRPIFKKGDKKIPGNYRPVSLTSIVCKIFEGFVRDSLIKHLSDHDLLSDRQYGFSSGRSCTTQLLTTINDWMTDIDEGKPVDAIYLDLRKAFDTVPHRRLVHKLKGYSIDGPLLRWVEDFLTGRSQYVKINCAESATIPVSSGVPQGSVLGPTLFVYFINDLPEVVDCMVSIFADDTKAYTSVEIKEKSEMLQESLNKLVEWSNTWLLQFNKEKCKVMHFGRNNPGCDYYMKDNDAVSKLECTGSEKDLGVVVDQNLSFEDHVNETSKKGSKISGLLVRTITYKDKDIMVPLFKALVRPILEYGNTVWCPYHKKNITQIENVQRHFTKCIVGYRNLSYEERLRALRLPTLEFRRLRGDMIEVFKILHEKYDPKTTKSLLCISDTSSTRGHSLKLTKKTVCTNLYNHFFTNRIVNMWNSLPNEVVTAGSINAFKNRLDKHLSSIMYSTNLFGESPIPFTLGRKICSE